MMSRADDHLKRGFAAVAAVIMLALGTLAFSLAANAAAISYADMVGRREMRIQARIYAGSCLDSVMLMAAKDYFLTGEVRLDEFGCHASIVNDLNGRYSIDVTAAVSDVTWRERGDIYLPQP